MNGCWDTCSMATRRTVGSNFVIAFFGTNSWATQRMITTQAGALLLAPRRLLSADLRAVQLCSRLWYHVLPDRAAWLQGLQRHHPWRQPRAVPAPCFQQVHVGGPQPSPWHDPPWVHAAPVVHWPCCLISLNGTTMIMDLLKAGSWTWGPHWVRACRTSTNLQPLTTELEARAMRPCTTCCTMGSTSNLELSKTTSAPPCQAGSSHQFPCINAFWWSTESGWVSLEILGREDSVFAASSSYQPMLLSACLCSMPHTKLIKSTSMQHPTDQAHKEHIHAAPHTLSSLRTYPRTCLGTQVHRCGGCRSKAAGSPCLG